MLSELEKEVNNLIRLGKRTGDMKLRNYARKALFGILSDDGTYGLTSFLYETEVWPNVLAARERAYEITHAKICSCPECYNQDCSMNVCGLCHSVDTILWNIPGGMWGCGGSIMKESFSEA